MNNNPMKALVKMYDAQVKKNNKRGYAKVLKRCAELFFRDINQESIWSEEHFHFTDIEFLSGYFIFGYGSNSVVHFHVKECPGWLFAIWWDIPDDKPADVKTIEGTFFAQYEETINKFKPSASEIVTGITAMHKDEFPHCECYDVMRVLSFIQDEPALAFCRDVYGWDYNLEYRTREEAQERFEKHKEHAALKAKYTKEFDDRVMAFVREKIVPCFNGAKIEDRGEDWTPRYDMVAPFSKNKEIIPGPCCYCWFDKDNERDAALQAEWDQIIADCKKISDECEFFWTSPIDSCILFYQK